MCVGFNGHNSDNKGLQMPQGEPGGKLIWLI